MCLEMAGSEVVNGSATWVTVASPRVKRVRIARRVGSARAAKTGSNCLLEYLTMWLTIFPPPVPVKPSDQIVPSRARSTIHLTRVKTLLLRG